MIDYKVEIIDSNKKGSVVRCPECGQVLCVLTGLEGTMKTVVQCRRCKSLVEIVASSECGVPHCGRS